MVLLKWGSSGSAAAARKAKQSNATQRNAKHPPPFFSATPTPPTSRATISVIAGAVSRVFWWARCVQLKMVASWPVPVAYLLGGWGVEEEGVFIRWAGVLQATSTNSPTNPTKPTKTTERKRTSGGTGRRTSSSPAPRGSPATASRAR